jgi:23S rRNA (cytosine1962-C5)-methyltransferase
MLKDFAFQNGYEKLLLKKRHLKNKETTVIFGNIEDEYAIENDMKFTLNLLKNQNIGYFGDMKNARSYIESIAKDKKVLNLFSYTCGFSLFAKRGGAKNIINVDMSKSSLSIGMKNHSLNNLETKGISFLPYNILKSFNALKKKGPFDIIIIDPPTFQKGSFDASKDYKKIISKLSLLSSADATILACLNSPDLDDRFLITLFNENAPVFEFEKKIPNPIEYQSLNEQKSLKTLVFKRKN